MLVTWGWRPLGSLPPPAQGGDGQSQAGVPGAGGRAAPGSAAPPVSGMLCLPSPASEVAPESRPHPDQQPWAWGPSQGTPSVHSRPLIRGVCPCAGLAVAPPQKLFLYWIFIFFTLVSLPSNFRKRSSTLSCPGCRAHSRRPGPGPPSWWPGLCRAVGRGRGPQSRAGRALVGVSEPPPSRAGLGSRDSGAPGSCVP